jgi:hypothetical protein
MGPKGPLKCDPIMLQFDLRSQLIPREGKGIHGRFLKSFRPRLYKIVVISISQVKIRVSICIFDPYTGKGSRGIFISYRVHKEELRLFY